MAGLTCFGTIDWQAVGAVGTLLAVVAALAIPFLPRILIKPNLELIHLPELPLVRKATTNDRGVAPPDHWYYARMRVLNRGNGVASDVEVHVGDVVMLTDENAYASIGCDPGVLKISNLGWRTMPQLPPGANLLVDLGHVVDPIYRADHRNEQVNRDGDPNRNLFALDVDVAQKTSEHILEPGTYRITLYTQASNARPKAWIVEMQLERYGDFDMDAPEFFRECVKIRVRRG